MIKFQTLVIVSSMSLASIACIPDFPAESPYDPETPAAQQAPAEISAQIVPELEIDLTQVKVLAEGQGEIASADTSGNFKAELAAGDYELSLQAPDHEAFVLGSVSLGTGEKRNLGQLKLVAIKGRIEGSVSLGDGANASGTLVSVSKLQRTVLSDATHHCQ